MVHSVLLSGTGNVSLMLADSSTSADVSLTDDRKAVVFALPNDSKEWSPDLPMQFTSGLFCSMDGTGAVATIAVQERS